jgi:hypothetical protein
VQGKAGLYHQSANSFFAGRCMGLAFLTFFSPGFLFLHIHHHGRMHSVMGEDKIGQVCAAIREGCEEGFRSSTVGGILPY